jgi:UDP-N-acetyl-D-glucosamine dehydrogenase
VDTYVPSLEVEGTVLKSTQLTDEELGAADCVLILTDHPTFDYQRIVEGASLVVDSRNATWGIPAAEDRVIRI